MTAKSILAVMMKQMSKALRKASFEARSLGATAAEVEEAIETARRVARRQRAAGYRDTAELPFGWAATKDLYFAAFADEWPIDAEVSS